MKNMRYLGLLMSGLFYALQATSDLDCPARKTYENSKLISTEEKMSILEQLLKKNEDFSTIKAVACDIHSYDRFNNDHALRKVIELALYYSHKELLENTYKRAYNDYYDEFRLNPKMRFAWALNYLCSLEKTHEEFKTLRDIVLRLTPNDSNNLYPIDACNNFCLFGLCMFQDPYVEELCTLVEEKIEERHQNYRTLWFESLAR